MCASVIMSLFNVGCVVAAAAIYTPNEGGRFLIDDGRHRQLQAANWDINYVSLTMDIIRPNSAVDILIEFEIEKDRVHAVELLANDCEGNITDLDVFTAATPMVIPSQDSNRDLLSLGYNLDMSILARSNIWIMGDTVRTATIEFCHVLKLILPASDTVPMLLIAEDLRKVVIYVNLLADFNITQVALKPLPGVVKMIFLGELSINNFSPSTPEQEAKAIEAIIASVDQHAEGGLGSNQTNYNTTIISFEVNQTERITNVVSELILEEGCENRARCAELMNTTTMYDNVTSHLEEQFDNGGFVATLNAMYVFAGRYLTKESSSNHPMLQDDGLITVEAEFSEPEVSVEMGVPLPLFETTYGVVSADVNVNSYIEACKCDGAQSFNCNVDATLSPNSELVVCIKSKSSDIELDSLESLVMTQSPSAALNVIEESQVKYQGITSMEYVPGKNGVVITTRVPSNLFSFRTNEFITITGVVETKLAGSDRRGLFAVTRVAGFEKESPFQLKVKLVDELNIAEKVATLASAVNTASSAIVTNWGSVPMGMLASFAYAMFW